MPQLLDDLPYFCGVRHQSLLKQYPLDDLLELVDPVAGVAPLAAHWPLRPRAALQDPLGRALKVKRHQIPWWISVGFRNKDRGDGVFPAILDTGCNNTLVASLWTLQVWARSAAYDVLDCKILDLVQETVAGRPARRCPSRSGGSISPCGL